MTRPKRRKQYLMLTDLLTRRPPDRKAPGGASKARAGAANRKGKPKSAGRKRAANRPRAAKVRGRKRTVVDRSQRRLDLIGLACIGLAVYFGYVLYLEWDGGAVGNGAAEGLALLFGAASILAPVALLGTGLLLILRPALSSPQAVAAGCLSLGLGLLLALAAQTAGLGGGGARDGYFNLDFVSEHGGLLGESLYWASSSLVKDLGANILALCLIASGALLLSGRSLADLLGSARRGATRAGAGAASRLATAVHETRRDDPDVIATEPADTEPVFGPPEPIDTVPIITRVDPEETDDPAEESTDELEVADLDSSTTGPEGDPPESSEPVVVALPVEQERTPQGETRGGYTQSDGVAYACPSPKLLERGKAEPAPDGQDHQAVGTALLEALGHHGVEARLLGVVSGPHVSRYELQLAPGTKVAKISQLRDDLAYALASTDIRILAPIPGKQAVGVEVPNQDRRLVRLGDIYAGRPKKSSPLVAWLGKDIAGHSVWTDLQKMPHVLVAGTTGSGKSGCVNSVLTSLLLHASPNDLRLVLVDPKQVELNHYESVPHLLCPVVTSPRLAANVLNNLLAEMESRYKVMSEARARNLDELNRTREKQGESTLPYILCVIDELADLMMVAPAEVEDAIIRLAQKSRAVGIHLLLATQRPSADIITGTIKVNIPARIAFAVSSQVDSRVILDQGGAETLLGQGDMLFRPAGTSKLQRIQGAFVTESEIAAVTAHWSEQGAPVFDEALLDAPEVQADQAAGDDDFDPDSDDLLDQAAAVVVESGTASVSMIQRRLRVGYTRAGRLVDMLERRGIISGYEGSKARQVLVTAADLPGLLAGNAPETGDREAPEHQGLEHADDDDPEG